MAPAPLIKFFALLGLIGGLVLLAVSWRTAADHVAPVRFSAGPAPTDFPLALEDISFRTRDGLTLRGWYGQAPDERGTVILLHRYRAGRGFMLSRARWYAERGYSVLLYDARATGESDGDIISVGWLETDDLTAALAWTRQQGAERILCHGVSQGGATIVLAADRLGDDVVGVVLESTYDTLLNAGDRRFRSRVGLPGWLAGIFYRPFMEMRLGFDASLASPIDHIGQIDAPIFILAGKEDLHTWADDTRALHAAAQAPTTLWLVEGAAHVDLMAFAPEEFSARLSAFLDEHEL